MCCHPALDLQARVALTLRCVCGLAAAEIAAAFVVPEATLAQRLVRAKRKIRQAGIQLKSPGHDVLPRRLGAVLRVVYLIFTQGHMAPDGPDLVRGTLCEQAIRLARAVGSLMPDEPEVTGLLALLLLLTDARREAPDKRRGSGRPARRSGSRQVERGQDHRGNRPAGTGAQQRHTGPIPAACRHSRLPCRASH
jgi:RNA polymerase sigma-70 factor (ECF subfamily)